MTESNKPKIKFTRCLCHEVVEADDQDGYILQVRKFGTKSPGTVWAHGPCLRKVMPVIGEEIPGKVG